MSIRAPRGKVVDPVAVRSRCSCECLVHVIEPRRRGRQRLADERASGGEAERRGAVVVAPVAGHAGQDRPIGVDLEVRHPPAIPNLVRPPVRGLPRRVEGDDRRPLPVPVPRREVEAIVLGHGAQLVVPATRVAARCVERPARPVRPSREDVALPVEHDDRGLADEPERAVVPELGCHHEAELVRPAVDDLPGPVVAPDLARGARVVDASIAPRDGAARRTLRADRPAGERVPVRVDLREPGPAGLEVDRLLLDALVPPRHDRAVRGGAEPRHFAVDRQRPSLSRGSVLGEGVDHVPSVTSGRVDGDVDGLVGSDRDGHARAPRHAAPHPDSASPPTACPSGRGL